MDLSSFTEKRHTGIHQSVSLEETNEVDGPALQEANTVSRYISGVCLLNDIYKEDV